MAGHLFQDVTSLGGTFRIRADRDKYHRLVKAHNQLRARLFRYDAELARTKVEIERQVAAVQRHLRAADRMLRHAPGVGLSSVLSPAVAESAHLPGLDELPATPKPAASMKTAPSTVAGLGAGAFTSVGTWGTAEILSHSTAKAAGTGLSALIARAGLAGVSGGLPTTGTTVGAMVASSPLIITGVGAAIALAVSAKVAHSHANELSETCKKLKESEKEGAYELARLASEVQTLELLEAKLKNQDRVLARAITLTKRRLLRFGPFSHVWRMIQVPVRGSYYTPQELPLLEHLNGAVLEFVAAFKKRTAFVPATSKVA